MKFALVICFVAGFSLSLAVPAIGKSKVADKTFLEREKNILRLLMHIHQPNTFQDQIKIAQSWKIDANLDCYNSIELVKEFLQEYNYCYLPRGRAFSILDRVHRDQAIKLFNVLYFAKDFDTFYKTACWARDNVNELMFVYALTAVVLHRPDCQGIILPAPYEIYPYYFVNSDVVQKVYKYRMQNYQGLKNVNNEIIVPANYSGWYLNIGQDQKLTYFTEDVGLNSFYYYFRMDYPNWMGSDKSGLNKDRRGELYYFIHQQLLARYYMERLSNGLGSIPLINFNGPVGVSYVPSLQYHNGLYFPFRPSKTDLIFDDYTRTLLDKIYTVEIRIRNAIDSGFALSKDGYKVPLLVDGGINIVGNMIEGNPDSPHRYLYGFLPTYMRELLGFSGAPLHPYKLQPSVLEHYETSLRDPAFYSICKKIINLFQLYKQKLPTYKSSDLIFQGVKIENIDIDKLVTYFDYYDFDLNNLLYTDYTKELQIENDIKIKARQSRLNHKPFTYRINLESETASKAVVRVYLGPKYDENGQVISLPKNRLNFYLLDGFKYELKVGKNTLERNSRQFRFSVKDRTNYLTLYQKVMQGIEGNEEFILDNSEAHCGMPNRLILPRGNRDGMVYQLYVIVSPLKDEIKVTYDDSISCGVGSGTRYLDNLPFGYPFDRPIEGYALRVPNIYHQEVIIYHRREEEINASIQN